MLWTEFRITEAMYFPNKAVWIITVLARAIPHVCGVYSPLSCQCCLTKLLRQTLSRLPACLETFDESPLLVWWRPNAYGSILRTFPYLTQPMLHFPFLQLHFDRQRLFLAFASWPSMAGQALPGLHLQRASLTFFFSLNNRMFQCFPSFSFMPSRELVPRLAEHQGFPCILI